MTAPRRLLLPPRRRGDPASPLHELHLRLLHRLLNDRGDDLPSQGAGVCDEVVDGLVCGRRGDGACVPPEPARVPSTRTAQRNMDCKISEHEYDISGGRCSGDGSPLGPVAYSTGGLPPHPLNPADDFGNTNQSDDEDFRGERGWPRGDDSNDNTIKDQGGGLIEIVTFNCTAGSGLFNFLNGPAGALTNKVINKEGVEVDSVMVCIAIQEHHLITDEQVDDASARLANMGWSSYWSPALRLPSGMPSGGTAVLVHRSLGSKPCHRLGHGLSAIPAEIRHRVAGASVSIGDGELDVYSVYLVDGAGMNPCNVDLLSSVASVLPERQCIVAGDFQNKPAIMEQSGFVEEAGLEVVAPPPSQPSIRSNLGNYNVIDYFLCSYGISALVEGIHAKTLADFRPHRPVGLHLPRGLADTWCRTWRLPPALPRAAVFGPRPHQPTAEYEDIKCEALSLARAAEHMTDRDVQRQLSKLYRRWSVVAEGELCGLTGVAPWGSSRGRPPQLVWRRVLDLPRRLPTPIASLSHRTRAIFHHAELVVQMAVASDMVGMESAWSMCTSTSDLWTEIEDDLAVHLHSLLCALGWFVSESRSAVERHGCVDTDSADWLEARGELEACIDQWAHLARRAEAQQKEYDQKALRKWALSSLEQGAKRAHKVGRQVNRWMATTVVDAQTEDGRTAVPMRVLASAVEKWAKVWQAHSQHRARPRPHLPPAIPDRGFDGQPAPEPATAEQVRTAANTFAKSTAIQVDGFHMRHFSLLCDSSLLSLGALFSVVDATGMLPRQVCHICMPMLPKKTGGHRLIGLYAGFYRLWARLWVPAVGVWERGCCDQPWMSACRGRAPTDIVFRSELRAQGAVTRGEVAGSISCDISSFYEVIDHSLLATRARDLGFPLAPLRGAIRGYRLARFLVASGAVASPLCTLKGIVAGDSFATPLVKCFYRRPFDVMLASWRAVGSTRANLDVYLDDITVSTASTTDSQLVSELAKVFSDIKSVVEDELGASIHPSKTQVVSSSLRATDRLAKLCVGRGAATMCDSYCLLGVDLRQTARWRRRRGRPTARSTRMAAAGRRHRRMAIFRRLAGGRTTCLFKSGIQSVASYGVEVTGLSDTCLHKLQSWACRYMCPTRASRSAVFALDGDPTLAVSVAVAVRWAKEVWQSSWDSRALSLPDLRTIFHDGWEARSARRWATSRGPLSAISLELKRVGWSWPGAFVFRNDLDEDIVLTEVAPGRLMQLFAESRSRQLCRVLASRSASSYMVDPSPVLHVLKSKLLSGRAKGALRRAFQGAVFTLDRLDACGYDLPTLLCPLCGGEPDSMHHRIFKCSHPDVVAVRADLFEQGVLAELAASRSSPEAIQGWIPSPPLLSPFYGDELEQAIVQRAVSVGVGEVEWQPCEWSDLRACVRHRSAQMCCFTDGSMFKEEWRSSWRAGWGLYIDCDSQPAFRAFGPVAGPAQTVPTAEWTAVLMASSFWPPSAPLLCAIA